MVGAVCVVGLQLVNSKTCLCLCLDSSSSCVGDFILHQKKVGPPLELRTSFLHRSSIKSLLGSKNLQKIRKKKRGLVIQDNLGGQYDDNFEDVQRQMLEFFTYKAVRTVLNQLYEMNPPQYRWLYDYIASNSQGYGKTFIRNLGKEKHELAERVMVTRLHLYGKWIKKCDHAEMHKRISDQNLELLRERLMEMVVWPPSDDSSSQDMLG